MTFLGLEITLLKYFQACGNSGSSEMKWEELNKEISLSFSCFVLF